jgi:hypothetical protein
MVVWIGGNGVVDRVEAIARWRQFRSRFGSRNWTILDWVVALTAAVVLVSSFLPWYYSGWAATARDGTPFYDTNHASAWQASTWWSVAIVLALGAAVGWLSLRALFYAPAALYWLPAATALAALGLAVGTWALMKPMTGPFGWYSGDSTRDIGDIPRDALYRYHAEGRDLDVSWGFPVGAALMALLTVILSIGWWTARRRPR